MTSATTIAAGPSDAPLGYRFGTGVAGVWLGLGLVRVALLAAGLLGTVVLLALRTGLPVGVCPLLVAAAVTLLPVAGRPLSGWIVPLAGHGRAAAAGSTGWTAPVPHASLDAGGDWAAGHRLRLPPECGRFRMQQVAAVDGWPVAVLTDRRSSTATLLFAVAGPDRFGLLDPDGQDRAIAGWGRALTALARADRCGGRVQLLERVSVAEADTAEARGWAATRGDAAVDALSSLAGQIEQVTLRRDSVIAVRTELSAGPREAVVRAREIAGVLLAAELVARPLSGPETLELFRRIFDSTDTAVSGGVGPVSRRSSWDHVRTDDTWHRSYAVTGWPGSPVPAGWLSSLLLAAPPAGAWTISVHLGAVAPELAGRLARAARAKAELDRADRSRLGLAAGAAADKAVADSAGMDAELVAGHATHRLAAVLTCTAGSLDGLADCGRGLREAAGTAGLTVRPLHGQHQLALAAALPLCRLRFGGVQ